MAPPSPLPPSPSHISRRAPPLAPSVGVHMAIPRPTSRPSSASPPPPPDLPPRRPNSCDADESCGCSDPPPRDVDESRGNFHPPSAPPYVKEALGSQGGIMEACCLQSTDTIVPPPDAPRPLLSPNSQQGILSHSGKGRIGSGDSAHVFEVLDLVGLGHGYGAGGERRHEERLDDGVGNGGTTDGKLSLRVDPSVCGQRTTKAINPHAYTDGTMFVQLPPRIQFPVPVIVQLERNTTSQPYLLHYQSYNAPWLPTR
uniref:Uncharacterized protein n=1 Tax=Zea mays TaxID=4577 RepID=A0A804PMI8_MAIZE